MSGKVNRKNLVKYFLACIFLLSVLWFYGICFAATSISFVSPTVADGAVVDHDSVEVNMNIDTPSLSAFNFNWNGNGYSIYDDSLVFATNFDNNAAIGETATTTVDISKYANNGTCSGSACPTWTSSGKFGGALRFDGANDQISAGSAASLNLDGKDYTYLMWIKPSVMQKNRSFFYRGYYNKGFIDSNGELLFEVEDANGSNVISVPMAVSEKWYFIAYTVTQNKDQTARIFDSEGMEYQGSTPLNGLTRGADGNNLKFSETSGWSYDSESQYAGLIDEVRIYNRALSDDEIKLQLKSQLSKHNSGQFNFYSNPSYLYAGNYIYSAVATDSSGAQGNSGNRSFTFQPSSPVAIYNVPAMTDYKILADSYLSNNFASNNISITAAPGEYEPASFVVRSYQDITGMTVEATNLNFGDKTISSDNIDIKVVKTWYQAGDTIWVGAGKQKILTPELLLNDDSLVKTENNENYLKVSGNYVWVSATSGIPGMPIEPTVSQFPVQDAATLQPVSIPGGTNKQFWVTVKVPDGATAGAYTGQINLKTGATTQATISLSVNVLPINLLPPNVINGLYYLAWPATSGNGTITGEGGKNDTQMQSELRDLLDHGATSPLIALPLSQSASIGKILNFRSQAGINNSDVYLYDYSGARLTSYGSDLTSLKNS